MRRSLRRASPPTRARPAGSSSWVPPVTARPGWPAALPAPDEVRPLGAGAEGAAPPGADEEPLEDPGDEPPDEPVDGPVDGPEVVVEPEAGEVPAGAVELVDDGLVDDEEVLDEEVEEAPPPVPELLVEVVGGVAAGRLLPPWVARAATLAISSAAMARAAARIERPPTIRT